MELLKNLITALLLLWAITPTIAAVPNCPTVILIRLDDAWTRIITSAANPLVVKERVKFAREFLRLYYRYVAAD